MPFISESDTDRQFLLNMSFTYFALIYCIIKLQNCSSLNSRVIATKMSKCLLSLKVLQSNIKVPLVCCHFYMCLHLTRNLYCLVHLIYTAGDKCMRQNACFICDINATLRCFVLSHCFILNYLFCLTVVPLSKLKFYPPYVVR